MEGNVSKITSKLESSLNTEPTIEGALSAYQLLVGDLGPNETKEFSLRIWMHSDVTAMDKDSMNAVYHGKISVITSYNHIPTLSEMVRNGSLVTNGTGLYEIDHSNANITYTSDPIAINNLKQTEYRYAGSNPTNYVRFNNELWRIIGLVNTPEGQRVKLIRNESIGRYSWDTSDGRINSGNGINEWSQADALRLLNSGYDSLEWGGSLYYNRRSGRCYIGNQNYLSACNFSSNGLLDQSKGMVDAITWNTRANGTIEGVYIKMMDYYDLERSSNTGDICARGCDKSVARTTSWKGQVGLMYPSDYAYATSGGTTTNRTNCLNSTSWGFKSVSDCKNNDWLYYSGNQWMLMPFSSSFDNSEVSEIRQDGSVNSSHAYSDLWVRPVVYLKNEVQVTKGDGSNQNPYQLFYKVN